MNLLNRFTRIFVAVIFTSTSALAGQNELLEMLATGDMNGRSSVDFRDSRRNNIQFHIPKDSEAKVLETRKLSRTGSYAIKIKITKVGTPKKSTKNLPKEGDETWVHFSQKKPWLTLRDIAGDDVQDPDIALTALAKREGQGITPEEGTVANPTLPTKEEIKRNQKSEDPNLVRNTDPKKTEGDVCLDGKCQSTSESIKKNLEEIQEVKNALEQPPLKDPNNPWSNDPVVMGYSQSKQTKHSISYALRNKESDSTRLCYRYVKRALMGGDMIDKYPPGRHARDAVRDLKAQGMINMLDNPKYKDMIKSPEDVPKGAVIVYHNGTSESGDIQIKTDWGSKGGYVSDFYSSSSYLASPKARHWARKGKAYKIIGVMIKPIEG